MNYLRSRLSCLGLILFTGTGSLQAAELERFDAVRLVEADWMDGDSFPVQLTDGRKFTLRLYGADCLEAHVRDEGDAQRLRMQRRYFGISNYGGDAGTSIGLAKSMGQAAAEALRRLLHQPFTVHTAFADGRGDARYQRVYAFVTTAEGEDLATRLVADGLARAFGVTRGTPDQQSRDAYRESLRDTELVAARKGRGIWKFTDWETLPKERRIQREEEESLERAYKKFPPLKPVDLNTASRDELMQLPGVGEVTALRIIEHRPYKNTDDLQRVPGIGPKGVDRLRSFTTTKQSKAP